MICAEFQPQLAHPSRYGCLWKILPHLKRCHQEAITLNLYRQVHIIKNGMLYIYIYGLGYFTKLIIQPFGDSPNLNHHSSDRKRCLSFMGPLYRLHVTGTHGHLGRLEFQVPRWSFEDPNGLGSKLNVVQTKNIQTPDPINAIFAIWVLKEICNRFRIKFHYWVHHINPVMCEFGPSWNGYPILDIYTYHMIAYTLYTLARLLRTQRSTLPRVP